MGLIHILELLAELSEARRGTKESQQGDAHPPAAGQGACTHKHGSKRTCTSSLIQVRTCQTQEFRIEGSANSQQDQKCRKKVAAPAKQVIHAHSARRHRRRGRQSAGAWKCMVKRLTAVQLCVNGPESMQGWRCKKGGNMVTSTQQSMLFMTDD